MYIWIIKRPIVLIYLGNISYSSCCKFSRLYDTNYKQKTNKQGNVLSSLFRAVALFFLSTFWWKLFESPYPGCKGSLWSDSHTKCRDSLETRPTHIKFFEFFGNYQVVQDTGDSFLKIWFALKVISYLEVIFMLF